MAIGLERKAKPVVEDPEIAISSTRDGCRHDRLHLLRHDSDIGRVAAIIGEAVIAQAIIKTPEQDNIVLEPYIGAPSTAAATATSTTAEPATPTATAAAEATAATTAAGTEPTAAAAEIAATATEATAAEIAAAATITCLAARPVARSPLA